jgi:hypothetical protein
MKQAHRGLARHTNSDIENDGSEPMPAGVRPNGDIIDDDM